MPEAIRANPNKKTHTVKADLGFVTGRGYARIGNARAVDIYGPLYRVDMTGVRATYQLNPTTGVWETITIFPDIVE
ncbi:MAG: hypothetical protein R3C03_23000 [Pirellulaceae bacterium]